MTPIPPSGAFTPLSSFEGDGNSLEQHQEQSSQTGEDFANLLAAMWLTPTTMQLSQTETSPAEPASLSVATTAPSEMLPIQPLTEDIAAEVNTVATNQPVEFTPTALDNSLAPSTPPKFPVLTPRTETTYPAPFPGKLPPLAPPTQNAFPTPTTESQSPSADDLQLVVQPAASSLVEPVPTTSTHAETPTTSVSEPASELLIDDAKSVIHDVSKASEGATSTPVVPEDAEADGETVQGESQTPDATISNRKPRPILPHPPIKEEPKSLNGASKQSEPTAAAPAPTRVDQQLPKVTTGEIKVLETTDKQTSLINIAPAENTIVKESAQREANLMATYLAEASRVSREGEMSAVKVELSGNTLSSNSGAQNNAQQPNTQSDGDGILAGSIGFEAIAQTVSNERPAPVTTQAAAQIIAIAETVALRQTRSVRLRLRPEELGQIDIQLSRDSRGRVSVELMAERDNTRAVLSQTLDQLRETLQRAGVQVDRLQVRTDTASLSHGNTGTRDYSNDNQSHSPDTPDRTETASTIETETRTTGRVRNHKLLSLSA